MNSLFSAANSTPAFPPYKAALLVVLNLHLLFMRFVNHNWHLLGIAWTRVCVRACCALEKGTTL